MSTPNRLQEHWEEAQKFIKREWPKFSETTLKNINGDFDKFLFYLKDIYNDFPKAEAIARTKIQKFLNEFE